LRDLPLEVRLALPDGTGVLGVHASPGRDDGDGITPQRDEEELRRDLEGSDAHPSLPVIRTSRPTASSGTFGR
jgi:hypothetical protein